MDFSVFSFSINSLIELMITLLPMSVLEQTQSPILKQLLKAPYLGLAPVNHF